jgi:hypothetical protein
MDDSTATPEAQDLAREVESVGMTSSTAGVIRDADDVLLQTGQVIIPLPVQKVGFGQIIASGQVIAPRGSEVALGPAVSRLTEQISYYPYTEGAPVRCTGWVLSNDRTRWRHKGQTQPEGQRYHLDRLSGRASGSAADPQSAGSPGWRGCWKGLRDGGASSWFMAIRDFESCCQHEQYAPCLRALAREASVVRRLAGGIWRRGAAR